MTPFTWNIQNRQIHRDKREQWLPGIWERDLVMINGYRFLWDEKDVLELDDGFATVSVIDNCHSEVKIALLKTTDVHLYVSMWRDQRL